MGNNLMSRTERIPWLDVLKGIGIILVAVGHIYSNKIVFDWIYSFHMPLFFITGGLVYREKTISEDIKRRVWNIVIPYLSLGFLILIYWQLIERRFRNSDMSFTDSFLGLLSGSYDNLDFNVHLWFLPCFFITAVLFNIFVKAGGKKLAYMISALMSILYIVVPMPEMFWGVNRVFKYIGFYAIGEFAARKISPKILADNKIKTEIVSIIFIMTNFILSYFKMTEGVMWFVTAILGVSGVAAAAILIHKNRILQYFGQISLVVLCIHGPVYRVVIKIISILSRMETDAVRENMVSALVVVAVTLVLCSIAYEIIIRITPWMAGKSI